MIEIHPAEPRILFLGHIYTWNSFVPCFGGWTLKNNVFYNQNKGHLGSRYIYPPVIYQAQNLYFRIEKYRATLLHSQWIFHPTMFENPEGNHPPDFFGGDKAGKDFPSYDLTSVCPCVVVFLLRPVSGGEFWNPLESRINPTTKQVEEILLTSS